MPSDAVLRVQDLSKTFHLFASPLDRLLHGLSGGRLGRGMNHLALAKVSFELHAGETLGVLGRNGAGKTTMLGLLAGTIRPSAGSLHVPARIGTLISLGAGFDPESSGRTNLRQWGALHEEGPFTHTEEVWIETFTELGDALDRPVKTYSQGMQLRLGFAVATARRPDLLVIDEVMAVGDFFFRRRCHQRIKEFLTKGTAAILVSHDYTEILQFCQRAMILQHGHCSFLGPASDAVNHYLHSSRGEASQAPSIDSTELSATTSGLEWPEQNEWWDVSSLHQPVSVNLKRLAITNGGLTQQRVFQQGEALVVSLRFLALQDFAIPITTVVISDDRGNPIHGTSTYMRGDQMCRNLRAGELFEARFTIDLALRYGEYAISLVFGDIDGEPFQQRMNMTFEELGGHLHRHATWEIGIIAVIPRQGGTPTQMTHHGLVNLPGSTMTALLAPHLHQDLPS